MRTVRIVVAFALLAGFTFTAHPAYAVSHFGRECRTFHGPEGPLQTHVRACIDVDTNANQVDVRAHALITNLGPRNVRVHVSYIKLVRRPVVGNGDPQDVFISQPFVWIIASANTGTTVSPWFRSGDFLWNVRIRMWVCWINEPGDPCGGVQVWNSGFFAG